MTGDTISPQIEGPDDVRAWIVIDDELKDDDELEGGLFCPDCIPSYIGDGDARPVHHENFMADAFCSECEVFLGDE